MTDSVVLFGGTFNPIHIGHLISAINILEKTKYNKVLFVPVNIPTHKNFTDEPGKLHRYNMIKKALNRSNNLLYSDIELKRGGLSYTYDTVIELKKKYKEIAIVIGDDLVDGLATWKNIKYLSENHNFLCLTRYKETIKDSPYNIQYIHNKTIDISSTEIRDKIKKRQSIKYLVCESVEKYILKNKLYLDK